MTCDYIFHDCRIFFSFLLIHYYVHILLQLVVVIPEDDWMQINREEHRELRRMQTATTLRNGESYANETTIARSRRNVKSSLLDGETNRNWNPRLMTRIINRCNRQCVTNRSIILFLSTSTYIRDVQYLRSKIKLLPLGIIEPMKSPYVEGTRSSVKLLKRSRNSDLAISAAWNDDKCRHRSVHRHVNEMQTTVGGPVVAIVKIAKVSRSRCSHWLPRLALMWESYVRAAAYQISRPSKSHNPACPDHKQVVCQECQRTGLGTNKSNATRYYFSFSFK